MNAVSSPNDFPPLAREMIRSLNEQLADRDEQLADKEAAIEELTEQVRLLKAMYFAKRSEQQNKPAHDETQYRLFDEAEFVTEQEPEQESETIQVPAHSRAKTGRKPIPAEYPREEMIHDIPEEDKICPCGCTLTRIGEEVSEKLDYTPAKIKVLRHIRPKYACRGCEGVEDDGPTVKTAPMPPQIIPQGIVTPGLLSFILINKFVDGLPFYRQERMFDRLGVQISRATMSGWAMRAVRACEPLVELLYGEIRSGPIINMDETTVQVLREPGRKNTSKSQMWVARGGPPKHPVVLFHYDPSRSGEVAKAIVGDFQGYLQTDGYAGYNAVGEAEGITHVGCLVHVRRKFMDVLKSGSKKSKGGTAKTVVDLIGKIYHLEKQAREQELEPDQIRDMRQERAKPLMDKIKALLIEREKTTPPKGLLGKAVTYGLGQWSRIEVYLEDGQLSPDNNVAENAIRPFAVGRKNWLFSGSPRGAAASAAIYSLIETARANSLNPYDYLLHVFEKLPCASTSEDIQALLPKNLVPE